MVIYKITNAINGKIYIGKQKVYQEEYLGSGKLIKRAVEKYGKENFTKEIIEFCNFIKELNEKEIFWIKKYNSTDNSIGYNISKGGDGGDVFTNNPNKEGIRRKCSKKGEKNGMYNKIHKRESIELMSKNKKGQRKGIPTWNKGKKIKNYSEKYEAYFKTLRNNNPNSKVFIFISPNKTEYKIKGEFEKFCKENNIAAAWYFVGKGIIPPPRKPKNKDVPSEKRINLTGWEIKRYELFSES